MYYGVILLKKYILLNSNFEEITHQEYQYIEYLFNNYFIATNTEGKSGIIDEKENKIVDFTYDLIQTIKDKKIIQARDETIKDIHIQSLDDYVKIYNEETETYIDNNGNKIEDGDKLEEIKKNNAILRIENYKRITYGVEQYYYVEDNEK